MHKRITLKDIASRTGVTYQTVSKILRGSEINVTPEVRARVEATARKMGYVPNVTARNLRLRSSRLIGYSWEPDPLEHVNPVLGQFLQCIVDTAEKTGYHILLFPQRRGDDMAAVYTELARTGRVDGFILSSLNYRDSRVPALQHLRVPFVAFGRSSDDLDFPFVDTDNRAGMRAVVTHLVEQEHRRIAVIAWPEDSRVGADRLAGYFDTMSAAGLEIDPAWVIRGLGEFELGYMAARQFLKLEPANRPTAIVTLVDSVAIGAMRAIREAGLNVGQDIALTGFDDMPFTQYLQPGLTSVRQPISEIGLCVVKMLVDLLEGRVPEEQQVLIPPTLVLRESSTPSYFEAETTSRIAAQ